MVSPGTLRRHRPGHGPLTGDRTFLPTVKLWTLPCSLRKHFRGCPRSIIGYLEKLAKNDPRRFVWPKVKTINNSAFNWDEDPKGSVLYSDRQVRKALRLLESLRVITRARANVNGKMRLGWYVLEHYTMPQLKTCTLGVETAFAPPKKRVGRPISRAVETVSSVVETASNARGDRIGEGRESPQHATVQRVADSRQPQTSGDSNCEPLRKPLLTEPLENPPLNPPFSPKTARVFSIREDSRDNCLARGFWKLLGIHPVGCEMFQANAMCIYYRDRGKPLLEILDALKKTCEEHHIEFPHEVEARYLELMKAEDVASNFQTCVS